MISKKVALVSLYLPDVKGIPPLGLLYLATALKQAGHDFKIIHKEAGMTGEVISEIEQYQPDLVGMSVFTGYNNKKYVDLSKDLKSKGYRIVWGNAHPSLLPEQVLSEPSVDFVVVGEGERVIVDLANNLDNKNAYKDILGLGFKDGGDKVIVNQRGGFINMDDYLIDWSVINLEEYLVPYFSERFERTLAVTTSRGCPFNCQFCYNLVFNQRRWRAHSAEKIVQNLLPLIKKYNINAIRFLDDNFFVDKERAFKIASGLKLPYFADGRVECVDTDFVENLKRTGCKEIMFGFESGSNRILQEVVKKGSTTDNVINAVKLLRGTGIMASGSFVLGFPTEMKEEYESTMRFIVELLEINNHMAFTVGWFLPFPGTGLFEKAKECGFVPPNKTEEWDKFNRWRNDYKMNWLKWDYNNAVKYSRVLVHLLALSYKRNIPFFKWLLKRRVKTFNFSIPVDIWFLSRLRYVYLFGGERNSLNRIIRRAVVIFLKMKKKNKKSKYEAFNNNTKS